MTIIRIKQFLMLLTLITAFKSCNKSTNTTAKKIKVEDLKKENVYAIKNVNIIPMTENGEIIKNSTVIIEGNTIKSINDVTPNNSKIIDGSGKWLIPGLIDMHVHGLSDGSRSDGFPTRGATIIFNTQDLMTPYVVNGVTTIFELSERVGYIAQRNQITNGDVIGPRMALTGFLDGGEGNERANTPEEARQTVRIAKHKGYKFIKVYTNLNQDTYHAAIDEASKQNMKVVGHIPMAFVGKTEEAFVPNFGLIAHAEELSKQTEDYSYRKAQEFAQLAKNNGTWLMPNLSNMERIIDQARSLDYIRDLPSLKYVHPLMQTKWLYSNNYADRDPLIPYFEKQVEFHKLLVRAFKEAGVPMVTGTDSGTSGIVWGFSLHDELEFLVEAGMTTQEALEATTRLPAMWLGIEDKTGTIESGKLADLVLLDQNPLENISNTKKIAGVFVNGKWIDKTEINKMLDALEKNNIRNKEKYDWRKRDMY